MIFGQTERGNSLLLHTDEKKTRAVIDLDIIAANYRHTAALCAPAKVAAVVKADAYGHGALAVAGRLQSEGCDFFTVSGIDEALELRNGGIRGTILVLGYILDDFLEEAIAGNISLAVDTVEHLEKILHIAAGRTVRLHIKLDTGMNRTGFSAKNGLEKQTLEEELVRAADIIVHTENAVCEGVFSHFAMADEPDGADYTRMQFDRFCAATELLKKQGLQPIYRHICNSAGIVRFPEMHLDAVRMGVTLYGCGNLDKTCRPAMSFMTKIINVHSIAPGESVSYGCVYTADRPRRIAVIGAGYADGFKRCLSQGGCVLCHGKRASLVGRICMDMAMIDVTDIPEACVGDDVVVFGTDGKASLTAEEVAALAGTIPYEILCAVSARVPRVYRGRTAV